MKYKTTRKEVVQNSSAILAVGYCEAQHLLQFKNPVAYTCGVYGWNFDVYEVNGVTICTGYRNMPGKKPDYDRLRHFEKLAESIIYDTKISYNETVGKVNELLYEWLDTEFATVKPIWVRM